MAKIKTFEEVKVGDYMWYSCILMEEECSRHAYAYTVSAVEEYNSRMVKITLCDNTTGEEEMTIYEGKNGTYDVIRRNGKPNCIISPDKEAVTNYGELWCQGRDYIISSMKSLLFIEQ